MIIKTSCLHRPASYGPPGLWNSNMQLSQEDQHRLRELIDGYAKLRHGQTVEDVAAILGPPTSTQELYAKTRPNDPPQLSLEYKIAARDTMPNKNDILISIIFDKAHHLIGAEPLNIPNLKPLRLIPR